MPIGMRDNSGMFGPGSYSGPNRHSDFIKPEAAAAAAAAVPGGQGNYLMNNYGISQGPVPSHAGIPPAPGASSHSLPSYSTSSASASASSVCSSSSNQAQSQYSGYGSANSMAANVNYSSSVGSVGNQSWSRENQYRNYGANVVSGSGSSGGGNTYVQHSWDNAHSRTDNWNMNRYNSSQSSGMQGYSNSTIGGISSAASASASASTSSLSSSTPIPYSSATSSSSVLGSSSCSTSSSDYYNNSYPSGVHNIGINKMSGMAGMRGPEGSRMYNSSSQMGSVTVGPMGPQRGSSAHLTRLLCSSPSLPTSSVCSQPQAPPPGYSGMNVGVGVGGVAVASGVNVGGPHVPSGNVVPQHQVPSGYIPAFGGYKKEIIFPSDCVESTQLNYIRRKKLYSKDVPPIDPWRLLMCLKSGLLAESTWALDILTILINDDSTVLYFGLQHLKGLLDALLEHYKRYLNEM